MAILSPSQKATGTSILKNASNALGTIIDTIPVKNKSGTLFGNKWIDVSKSLQNFQLVKPAYASDSTANDWSGSYGTMPQSSSSSGKTGSGGRALGQTTGSGLYIPSPTTQTPNGMSEMDIIDQDYNNFSSSLDAQESSARQNYSNLEGQIGREKAQGIADLTSQEETKSAELNKTAESGRATERLNLQKVRQLLADLEQRNAAQGAIGGGGSMSEALAEKFGRTAQSSVGQVLSEGQRFGNDVAIELSKAKSYYTQAKQKVTDWAQTQLDSARATLNDNLNAIAASRRDSGLAKQKASMSAWRDYFNTVNQANLQAANFSGQYDKWYNNYTGIVSQGATKAGTPSTFTAQDPSGALNTVNNSLTTGGNVGLSTAANTSPSTMYTTNTKKYIVGYDSNGQPIYSSGN